MIVLLSTKLDLSQKGFQQVQGVDYNEIFSTVAMLKSVRIMLEIATFYEIWQMDIKNCVPEWISRRRVVYDATRRFCQSKGC